MWDEGICSHSIIGSSRSSLAAYSAANFGDSMNDSICARHAAGGQATCMGAAIGRHSVLRSFTGSMASTTAIFSTIFLGCIFISALPDKIRILLFRIVGLSLSMARETIVSSFWCVLRPIISTNSSRRSGMGSRDSGARANFKKIFAGIYSGGAIGFRG